MLFRIIVLSLFLLFIGCIYGQSEDSVSYPYTIKGTIFDHEGNPLSGVNIISAGDGNMQVSDHEGRYYATIYNRNTAVIFSYYKFSSTKYCPIGRMDVDIVLSPEKKRLFRKINKIRKRIGYMFMSKKKRQSFFSCP